MGNILIVDDQKDICDAITAIAARLGHSVSCAHTQRDGVAAAQGGNFDLVLLDVRLPDGNGLDILPRLRKLEPFPEVIILTGYGDPSGAELAIRNGAWDYIEKPSSTKRIRLSLERAMQYQTEKNRRRRTTALDREGIVGNSVALRDCLELLNRAAVSDADVLLTGKTGTGKELFALAIHKNSRRAGQSFVVVDCTALPKDLVESMLFGHERGAFTGADRAQDGLIKQADGGTLFLDEVGELPHGVQKKFLRVLQERRYRPVGGKQERASNFRLVAATNQNLDQMVHDRVFREDLLFRLRSIHIHLPPLRERADDIKSLALHHISRLCEQYGTETKGFSPDFFHVLGNYDWPGNVRELNQALEKALASSGPNPVLFPKDLPIHIRAKLARESVDGGEAPASPEELPRESLEPAGGDGPDDLMPLQTIREAALADVERRYLTELLARTEGNIRRACEISGLSRSRLYALLKKRGVKP